MYFELKDFKAFNYLEINNMIVRVLSYFLLYPLDKMKAIRLHNFPFTRNSTSLIKVKHKVLLWSLYLQISLLITHILSVNPLHHSEE